MDLETLQRRLLDLLDQAHRIRNLADGERRDLTYQESRELDSLLDAAERTQHDIERLERLQFQIEHLRHGWLALSPRPVNRDAHLTDTGSKLLREILSRPSQDDRRLVYADWLEENGRSARAGLIRVGVEIAAQRRAGKRGGRLPYLVRQERRLLTLCHTEVEFPSWVGPLRIDKGERGWKLKHTTVSRGFLCRVIATAVTWYKEGPALCSREPVEWVLISDRNPHPFSLQTKPFGVGGSSQSASQIPREWDGPWNRTLTTSQEALADLCQSATLWAWREAGLIAYAV